jgi:hypothetical protein
VAVLPKARHRTRRRLEKDRRKFFFEYCSQAYPARFLAKDEVKFTCRREKIYGKQAELERKIVLEGNHYNSKMASRVEIAL